MTYRREEWKDNGRGVEGTWSTERGVEGRWNTEERSGRKTEHRREDLKEDDKQKRGMKGRWRTEQRSGRKMEYRREEREEL
jgi:hypothetical protein